MSMEMIINIVSFFPKSSLEQQLLTDISTTFSFDLSFRVIDYLVGVNEVSDVLVVFRSLTGDGSHIREMGHREPITASNLM